jgi:hypothetical protein
MVRQAASFDTDQTWRQLLKERQDIATLQLRRTITCPPASTPWTWKTDLAMSKPIVVIVCMATLPLITDLRQKDRHVRFVPILLQKSFPIGGQKFCRPSAWFYGKVLRDLIASRQTHRRLW